MAITKSKAALSAHTAGIFADMTLDGPEIGTLVIVIDRAKNLPNRKTMGKQDPYCAMRLGKEAKKTDTDRRGGQTPRWDQELRFTVHDSPDYYRLKTSVFNDDKRTDLIGEAFIDLRDLIKPGGGSNDLWHNLNYKGKYAGDIRMEMTYYDVRPREDKPTEKRRHRDKVGSVANDNTATLSGPRQLGPREIKRRPLPASPVETPSPVTTPQRQSSQPPQPPPKIPITQSDTVHGPPQAHAPMTDSYRRQSRTKYGVAQAPEQEYLDQYQAGAHSSDYDRHEAQDYNIAFDHAQESFGDTPNYRSLPVHSRSLQSFYPDESEAWDHPGRHQSQNDLLNQELAPAHEFVGGTSRLHSGSFPQPYDVYQSSAPPVKSVAFQDNRLRHSIGQQENTYDFTEEPEDFDAPPPPPRHRETTPRRSQNDSALSEFSPMPIKPTPRRPTVQDRSPLQSIEHDFDPHAAPSLEPLHAFNPPRHGSHDAQMQSPVGVISAPTHQDFFDPYVNSPNMSAQSSNQSATQDHYHRQNMGALQEHVDIYGRRNSHNAFVREPLPHRPMKPSDRPGSYQDRQLPSDMQQTEHVSPYPSFFAGQHAYSDPNLSEPHANMGQSPVVVRPRPMSSTPIHTPPRKAISSGTYDEPNAYLMNSTPYGPDSYDVLNPASSPVSNEQTFFETPEQARESARLREVAKLRDQGPIIGNDGRVIDPSDHLPSDTWAPEPDKKQRKPEHVVHVRTRKNELRSQALPGSSPVSVRTNVHRNMPMSSPVSASPASAPPSTGRSRLQKPMASRPSPGQQYQPPRVDPAPYESPIQQSQKRYSYHDTSPGIQRPSLSEYQVPTGNSYNPRGSMYSVGNSQSPGSNERHPNTFENPLAAEMSMIDIGPSRGGRSALRLSRGY